MEKTPKNNLGQIFLQDFINVILEAEIVLISKIKTLTDRLNYTPVNSKEHIEL